MCGASIGHLIHASGQLLAGPRRLFLVAYGLHQQPASKWDCVHTVPVFFLAVGPALSATMNLALSIDRFLVIGFYHYYSTELGSRYVKIALLTPTMFCLPIYAYAWLDCYFHASTHLLNTNLLCVGKFASGMMPMLVGACLGYAHIKNMWEHNSMCTP